MSYTAFYRKYRPLTFSDVVGQEHITKTLESQLSTGKIFHAYLFTGTRGTGKTTCAKILAKAVNCLNLKDGNPCGECEACRLISGGEVMDIVEIDAASNNSVDNIRELRDQIQFTPANAKYRVYIIDEVHMLTISAFNALLKTLEEPPKHVIFVLATTEVHKLPATILSRCQRFDFKRIDPNRICERIKMVASQENFSITDSAAYMIASIADGGMRDALSILDLCVAASREVTDETVTSVCGMAGDEYLLRFADYIKNAKTADALTLVDELYNNSVDMLRLLNELITHFRNLLIVKTVRRENKPIICSAEHLKRLEAQALNFEIVEIMRVMRLLQDTCAKMQSGNRRSEMELCLIKLCSPSLCTDLESLAERVAALENGVALKKPINDAAEEQVPTQPVEELKEEKEAVQETLINTEPSMPEVEEPVIEEENEPEPEVISESEPTPVENSPVKDGRLEAAVWKRILSELSKSAPLISGILNDSNAYINDQFLLIETENTQFAELINGKNNIYREKLRKAIETVLGRSFKLGPYRKKTEEQSDDPLELLKNKLKALEVPNSK